MQPTPESLSPQEYLRRILEGKYPPFEAQRSPDGKYAVVIAPNEMRMSHWIYSAAVWNIETSTMLVGLGEDLWSTDTVAWTGEHALKVEMRRYPGDVPGITATLDLDQQTVQITSSTESASVPF